MDAQRAHCQAGACRACGMRQRRRHARFRRARNSTSASWGAARAAQQGSQRCGLGRLRRTEAAGGLRCTCRHGRQEAVVGVRQRVCDTPAKMLWRAAKCRLPQTCRALASHEGHRGEAQAATNGQQVVPAGRSAAESRIDEGGCSEQCAWVAAPGFTVQVAGRAGAGAGVQGGASPFGDELARSGVPQRGRAAQNEHARAHEHELHRWHASGPCSQP